jgi:hypothetical protein
MDYSLSTIDIKRYLDGKIRVIKYSELEKFGTLKQLLSPYDGCIILYETEENYGHWTLLLKNDWGIEFFDPYGTKIDDHIKQIAKNYRTIEGQTHPHLTALILRSTDYIISNNIQLQKKDVSVQTCGRWCIFRYINRRCDLRSFIALFDKYKLGEKDKLITHLVQLENEEDPP